MVISISKQLLPSSAGASGSRGQSPPFKRYVRYFLVQLYVVLFGKWQNCSACGSMCSMERRWLLPSPGSPSPTAHPCSFQSGRSDKSCRGKTHAFTENYTNYSGDDQGAIISPHASIGERQSRAGWLRMVAWPSELCHLDGYDVIEDAECGVTYGKTE